MESVTLREDLDLLSLSIKTDRAVSWLDKEDQNQN